MSIPSPDDQRLRVLASTRLLDSAAEEGFDRLTRLAARLLGAPTGLVSLVDSDRQFFKSAVGLAEPWASRRETPLTHSFCQYVVHDRAPLLVADARKHAVLRDNPAIFELGAVAYAGVPLIVDDEAVGALCVIDDKPHDWPADRIEILQDLAASVVTMIQLRIAAQSADGAGGATQAIVESMGTARRKVEAALRRSEEIHRIIVQHLPNGAVFVIDRDLRYVSADGPILGDILRQRDLDGLVGRQMADVLSAEVRDTMIRTVQRSLAGERVDWEIERDGHFYEMSVVPIHEDGGISHAMIAAYDVTIPRREAQELKRARDALTLQQSLLETTLAHIDEGVALIDGDNRILIANHAFASMLGMPRGMVEGMTREAFVRHLSPFLADPEGLAATLLAQPPDTPLQFQFARPRRRVLSRTWIPVALSEGDGMLVTWRDVTAEHDLLREREQLLLIDALTGIPNRRAAENAMRAEQQRMKRSGTHFCVALFDIDHFKRVNDVFGHGAGDEVLRVVAGSLTSQLRLTDTVARWGGEEFVAVLNVPLDGARIFCERTRQRVEALETPPVGRVTISGGVVQVGTDESLTEALERADKLLYQAKAEGRNRVHPPAAGAA